MKRYMAVPLVVVAIAAMVIPCQAQLLKKLEQNFLGGQTNNIQGQPTLVGNVNLPPGQYMMTNVQSGQAFYVVVQAGQMYLSNGPQQTPQFMAPGQPIFNQQQPLQQQGGGMGGLIKGGFGNFLKNELAPQQQGLQQQIPGQ